MDCYFIYLYFFILNCNFFSEYYNCTYMCHNINYIDICIIIFAVRSLVSTTLVFPALFSDFFSLIYG